MIKYLLKICIIFCVFQKHFTNSFRKNQTEAVKRLQKSFINKNVKFLGDFSGEL